MKECPIGHKVENCVRECPIDWYDFEEFG